MSEQSKKEFEDYVRGLNLKLKENGNHADKVVHNMWLTWQASRKSLVVKVSELHGAVVGQVSVADVEYALDAAGVRYE